MPLGVETARNGIARIGVIFLGLAVIVGGLSVTRAVVPAAGAAPLTLSKEDLVTGDASWSVRVGGGGPPAGPSLTSAGTLSGTPPSEGRWPVPRVLTIDVQVEDAAGKTNRAPFRLTVKS
jgi:Putative Ig domain